MIRAVACPVALHPSGDPLRLPVFAHPQAGLQLVKGGVRDRERPETAAARELFEESGLETRAALMMGYSEDIVTGERWHFALCRVALPVRTRWQHHCGDDGGHLFRFEWMTIDAASAALEGRYLRALDWIRAAL